MRLYIVRHAWAVQRGDPEWTNDDLRPLTEKGRKRFRRFLALLVERGFEPAHLATSPLVRCRQTAELIQAIVPDRPEVVELEALAPGSRLGPLVEWSQQQDGIDLAWVGHAPDVGRLAAELIGDGSAAIDLAKGAIAAIDFAGSPRPGDGTLVWLVAPKLLGR
ncbi:MAG: histidine phosphatase family protein [Pirellulales bacterium]